MPRLYKVPSHDGVQFTSCTCKHLQQDSWRRRGAQGAHGLRGVLDWLAQAFGGLAAAERLDWPKGNCYQYA